jgi:hypothetical protein
MSRHHLWYLKQQTNLILMKTIFNSYSHQDEAALNRLHTHLAVLQREKEIFNWFDRKIFAGEKIDDKISEQLENSDIFLALISPDFLASNYCYEKEMFRAIELHKAGRLQIVSVIIEPCDWQSTPLADFKVLPKDGRAIAEWTNVNVAYLDVVKEIRRLVNQKPVVQETIPIASPFTPAASSRYRIKRTFDAVDKADFRQSAFKVIRDYFHASISEIDSLEGIRARFADITSIAFSCTVLNKARQNSAGYLTVRSEGSNHSFGDINYSYSENAPSNTCNGFFAIEWNDYEMYLKTGLFFSGKQSEVVTPRQAAEALWIDLLDRAGITYS